MSPISPGQQRSLGRVVAVCGLAVLAVCTISGKPLSPCASVSSTGRTVRDRPTGVVTEKCLEGRQLGGSTLPQGHPLSLGDGQCCP